MEQLLKCSQCNQMKPTSDYYRCKTWKRGYSYRCKPCHRTIRARQWDKELERNRRYNREGRNKRRRRGRRIKAIENLGGKCECCGESRIEFLAIDHIHGLRGRKVKRNGGDAGDGTALKVNRLATPKDTYRVLCHNCNSSLGFYGYCPHKTTEDFLNR